MIRFTAGTCDVAVIGAGHAGIEAALAAARLGMETICFTVNLDSVGAGRGRAIWSGNWTHWAARWEKLRTRPASSIGC